jgi:hypothetical protein
VLSTELQLALAPGRVYRQLVESGDAGPAGLLGAVAFSALTLGLMIAFAAVRWVSVEVAATTTASFSFVLALQAVAAAGVILTAGRRQVGLWRAFELFFRGHAPWTLWMLGVGAAAIAGRGAFQIDAVALSVVAPAAWTTIMVAAFSRTVLGASRAEAWARALAHQAVIWAFGLSYIAWAAGGWMRIVEALTT